MRTSSKLLRREQCPKCLSEGRDSSENNLAIYDDGHEYCYAGHGLLKGDKEDFNILNSSFTYEYVPWRGITSESFRKYDAITKIDQDGKPIAIGFKYPNGSYKLRQINSKDIWWVKDQYPDPIPGLFGVDKFNAGESKTLTITEGELDAISLYQVLRSPVVSVQSAGSAARDCAAARSYINSFERIVLALDGDTRGREATASIARLFDYNKIFDLRFTKLKDANEYLQHGEEVELKRLWWNARRYQPEAVKSQFQEFEEILNAPEKAGVPYPFQTLNEFTYGIRTGESVLITAQEGVGKTELMHAIEYQLLQETDDNVGAIFLEEPKRRHLQAVAGLQLQKPVHLPDCNVTSAEVFAELQKAVGRDERLHIYSHFGSDDPESILDTIRYLVTARSCPYILLDHVSMVVSGLAGEDERKALDYLSTRLEMMVKELNFALIFVSHVNDEGKTRGSRYISKIADIRIDATRDTAHPDPVIRNTTRLVVSKNRFSGKTGPACSLLFDPATFTFKEVANDNWQPPNERVA